MIAPTALLRKSNAEGQPVLELAWNDGTRSEFVVRRLRLSCPCAACVNEWSGAKILNPAKVPKDVRIVRVFSVGRYAMGVEWSDGHSTGIYSYDYLRNLDVSDAAARAS